MRPLSQEEYDELNKCSIYWTATIEKGKTMYVRILIDDTQVEYPLTWQQAIALEPGSFVMAQDGTICLVIKTYEENKLEENKLLAFHPAFPRTLRENYGYAHFKQLNGVGELKIKSGERNENMSGG